MLFEILHRDSLGLEFRVGRSDRGEENGAKYDWDETEAESAGDGEIYFRNGSLDVVQCQMSSASFDRMIVVIAPRVCSKTAST